MFDSEGYFGRKLSYFGGDYFGGGYWGDGLARLGKFDEVIAALEKVKVGDYCFAAGCVEPGVDNANTSLRRILAQLEK